MKIIKLEAENIKRLKAVEVTPKGNIVKISGKNKQGKTSLLDSIYWALAGKSKVQDQPIRKGEEKGTITLDLGKYKVKRTFTAAGGTSLVVENTEGARFTGPQNLLNSMIGDLSFDPLAFTRESPAEQYGKLARIAGLGEELAKFEGREQTAFDDRQDANRDVKRLQASADTYSDLPVETPEAVDTQALWEEVNQAERHNFKIDSAVTRVSACSADMLREEAALKTAKSDHEEASKALIELGEPIDTTNLLAEVEAAKEAATNSARFVQRDSVIEQLAGAQKDADRLDKAVERNRKARVDMLNKATFPVEGLSLEGGCVTFNGLPFDQASAAEILQVSMAIAMHANPDIRIIRITDASLLDSDSMAIIEEMADAEDFQIWLEIVDESKKIGVVIEDGEVVRVNKERKKTA